MTQNIYLFNERLRRIMKDDEVHYSWKDHENAWSNSYV